MTNEGKVWRCRVWPYSWRCHQDGYEPGEDFNGLPLYLEAWEEVLPTNAPSIASSNVPSAAPSNVPSVAPSDKPSLTPSESPSNVPSESLSNVPSESPSDKPSLPPSESPSNVPSESPSNVPSTSAAPSDKPSLTPSESPSNVPSESPSDSPSNVPSVAPSNVPSTSVAPSDVSSESPSNVPSVPLSNVPSTSAAPSDVPSVAPSNVPSESHVPSVSAAPSCQGQLRTARNICFALDESGSVCSYQFDLATYPNAKCKNFWDQLNFSKSLVTALEATDTNFSVVTFAGSATVDQQLAPAGTTLTTLDNIVYSGGNTYTHLGINACQGTLANSIVENTIVLISDGSPSSTSQALIAADVAKFHGTDIVSVFIGNPLVHGSAISFMEQVSSTNTVHHASNFDDLPDIAESVLTNVIC